MGDVPDLGRKMQLADAAVFARAQLEARSRAVADQQEFARQMFIATAAKDILVALLGPARPAESDLVKAAVATARRLAVELGMLEEPQKEEPQP